MQLLKDKGFADVPWSTDGTRQIAESLPLECKLTYVQREEFWPNLVAARTFSLEYWKNGEWMYPMAADEILIGNVGQAFQKIRTEKVADVIYLQMREFQPKNPWITELGWKRRFFRWQQGLHWGQTHNDFRNKNNVYVEKWPEKSRMKIKNLWILHLKRLQFSERIQAANAYRKFGK